MHDLATYNHRRGKRVFLQLLECPKRDHRMLKGSDMHVAHGIPKLPLGSKWEHIVWAEVAVQQLRGEGKSTRGTSLQNEQAVSNKYSVAFATWFIVLILPGGLCLGGTKLRGGKRASAVKAGGTILPIHTASPSTCLKCFCSCWQVNDGLPQN